MSAAHRLANDIAAKLAELPSRTTPAVRRLRRDYSRQLSDATPALVIQTALVLVSRADLICRFFAYEIVASHKAAFASLTTSQLLKLGEGIDNWAAVDTFACYISGPAWRDGRLSKAVIRDWAQSADHWWRRAALVSTVALSRRGKSEDVRQAVEICAMAAADHEDMVAKALSWALRELAKKNASEVRRFLASHNDDLAARVKREVRNKLTTGLKNPRRKAGQP
jgi:3-methyladenine DNA glycosylase AlkD